MKVLLVNPPIPGRYQRFIPPLGLGYIGASLVCKSYEVKLLDLTLKNSHTLMRELGKFRPDVVGITGLSNQYPNMKECATQAKTGGATVVVGGLHVSAIPEFILSDCKYVDFVVKGEGEVAFSELLKRDSPVGIPGLYYRNNGKIVGLQPEYIGDLGSLPHPWTFLELSDYDGNKVNDILKPRGRQAVSVLTSRGCPYRCSFCSAPVAMGRKIRLRPVDDIISELKELVKEGVREVQFMDDNFTFYKEHAYSICDAMIRENLNLVWTLPNGIRADRVDVELLEKMKEAGCYYFGIGIESGSERLLKLMHKELSLSKAKETIRECDKLGFITQGFLLVGHPEETKEDLEATLKYVISSKLDRISINQIQLYPGSELFNRYCDPANINWNSLHRYRFSRLPKETRKFSRYMYFRFYLNPMRLFRHVRKFKTRAQWMSLFAGLRTLVSEVRR